MSMITTGDATYINGGPGLPGQLKIERERVEVWSSSPKVDRSWSFTDAAGHFHAAAEDKHDPWPTLRKRIEVVPCSYADHDEDCDGENITHWHCMICDEEITPGMTPGPHSESISGQVSWEARVSVPAEDVNALFGQSVSVRMEAGDYEVWGVAAVSGDYTYSPRQTHMDLKLIGVSALGRRVKR